jgi:hypothetical protein
VDRRAVRVRDAGEQHIAAGVHQTPDRLDGVYVGAGTAEGLRPARRTR